MQDIYSLSDFFIKNKIGEKIKFIRLKQNITQQNLADLAEISVSSVKKIENGEINSFDSFLKVLRILGKLDSLQTLVEPEDLSPNEYYEMKVKMSKKNRKRARGSVKSNLNEESEW